MRQVGIEYAGGAEAGRVNGSRQRTGFRTLCGREVRVGRMALGSPERPAWRVSLDIGHAPGRDDGAWAGLAPAEARRLAAALLAQATAAEHDAEADLPGNVSRIEVMHAGGESYTVATRGHALLTDQPASAGGGDAAPTPTELLVGALTSCVAFYCGRFLVRHGLDREGLRVSAAFTMADDRPARVGAVSLRITVPRGVPPQRRAALLAVASHCTVHNTLQQAPEVAIELA